MIAQLIPMDRPAQKVPLGLLVDLDSRLGPISGEAARELDLAWKVLVGRPWQVQILPVTVAREREHVGSMVDGRG